jgi:hypothetical protein
MAIVHAIYIKQDNPYLLWVHVTILELCRQSFLSWYGFCAGHHVSKDSGAEEKNEVFLFMPVTPMSIARDGRWCASRSHTSKSTLAEKRRHAQSVATVRT